jgi:hypothetical protein
MVDMKWVISSELDIFNLDAFFHIWVEKCPNGYFLMGELIHNGEEVVLSSTFDNECKAKMLLHDLSTPKHCKKCRKEFMNCDYDHWLEDALCYCDKCSFCKERPEKPSGRNEPNRQTPPQV